MINPPLKRHPALQPLSRDHYVGLQQAQRLMKAAQADAAARRTTADEFLRAWGEEISSHFDDEERLLPDLIAVPADCQRMLDEHVRIRALTATVEALLSQSPPGELLAELGQQLNDHIRWEERQLFPAIEAAAGAEQLTHLEEVTQTIEHHRPRSACSLRGDEDQY